MPRLTVIRSVCLLIFYQLGKQIADLEGEVEDKNAKLAGLERELDVVDKELGDKQTLHNQVISALKQVSALTPCYRSRPAHVPFRCIQKLGSSKSRHTELTIQQESLSTEVNFLENKVEELAMRCAELEEGRHSHEKQRSKLENEKNQLERNLRGKENELQDTLLKSKRSQEEMQNSWKSIVIEKDQVWAQSHYLFLQFRLSDQI